MDKILLILVLSGNPEAEPAAKPLAEALARLGGARVEVVAGAPARERLAAKGLRDGDLLAASENVRALTAREALAVIRIERRDAGGDAVLESRVWIEGRAEAHTAITGAAASHENAAELGQRAVRGLLPLVAPLMPDTAEDARDERERTVLAALVRKADWQGVLERVQTERTPTPRMRYFRVLALGRLNRLEEARAALAEFARVAPAHVLLRAAGDLLPRDGESDALRDPGLPPDDGGNVLR
jgi:hypothetical protein